MAASHHNERCRGAARSAHCTPTATPIGLLRARIGAKHGSAIRREAVPCSFAALRILLQIACCRLANEVFMADIAGHDGAAPIHDRHHPAGRRVLPREDVFQAFNRDAQVQEIADLASLTQDWHGNGKQRHLRHRSGEEVGDLRPLGRQDNLIIRKRRFWQWCLEGHKRTDELMAIRGAQHADDAKRTLHVLGQPVEILEAAITDGWCERENLSRREEVAEITVYRQSDFPGLLQCGLFQARALSGAVLPQQETRESQNGEGEYGPEEDEIRTHGPLSACRESNFQD